MQSITKLFVAIAITASALSSTSIQANEHVEKRLDLLEKRVSLLEVDKVVYGPIAVSHIHFDNAKNFAVAQPGQKLDCSFHYELDSSQQEFLTKNHLIVGLDGVGAEVCATHLYGVWDSTGNAKFQLTTPLKAGDYEVRIAYRPGETCEDALASWNVLKEEPSSFATIGVIRVVNP